jgi:hypothetical protein
MLVLQAVLIGLGGVVVAAIAGGLTWALVQPMRARRQRSDGTAR